MTSNPDKQKRPHSGGRQKGTTKTGGRQKGTPNKVSAPIKEAVANAWSLYVDSGQFAADIKDLEPQARISIMERLAQYISPKLKSVDADIKTQATPDLEQRLSKLVDEALLP